MPAYPSSPLPPGRLLDLPGRGTTFIREVAGPPGAPTVLLLHGWLATSAPNWHACFAPLGRHFHVVAIDQRGHGMGIHSRRAFRLTDCADDAAAVIRLLRIGPVIATGYSMGGPVAQLLWRRQRLRVIATRVQMEQGGVNAVPIVGLLWCLIGVVMAYQGADQLRRFGAEIYTVNLLGIAILRELGVV